MKETHIVDIPALPKHIWHPRLEKADVLFFSGGNSFHLMRWIQESGLEALLPTLLKTRVWAGISAGSIVTNPSLALSSKDKKIYYEEQFGYNSGKALNLVDLYVRPHLNSPDFPHARVAVLEEVANGLDKPLYGLDDQSALKIVDGHIETISEGEFVRFN